MLIEELNKKWQPVLEHPELEAISDSHKRQVTAQLLENTRQLYARAALGQSTAYLLRHQSTQSATAPAIPTHTILS